MRRTVAIMIIIGSLLFSGGGISAEDCGSGILRIYLPREIVIRDNTASVGEVGIIRGDEGLAAKAGEVVLGHITVPGQEVTVDRGMLLSRLACSGIPVSKVKLSGAERVKVRRKGQTIKVRDLVESAKSFLVKNPPAGSICQTELTGSPKDLLLSGVHRDIKLVPRIVKNGAGNRSRVDVSVMSGDKEIGVRRITFRHKYNTSKIVTLGDIKAGEAISRENVKIEKTVSDYPQATTFSEPYGLVAKRHLPKGRTVQANMVGPAKPAILVKRNQSVIIRIRAGGLTITATGKMVDEGAVGDIVRVRNVDSLRVITAKVNEDGTVAPIL